MDSMKKKVTFGILFVVFAFAFMFSDALFHIDFKSKPSTTLTHEVSGAHTEEGNDNPIEETIHVTQEAVDTCFGHHGGDNYKESLSHCQEEICENDAHCFGEIEEMSEAYK